MNPPYTGVEYQEIMKSCNVFVSDAKSAIIFFYYEITVYHRLVFVKGIATFCIIARPYNS